jgi:hypothetical protein
MTGKPSLCAVLGALILVWFAQAAPAANITVTSEVSADRITLNDRLELTVTVTGPDARKAGSPQLKPMQGFTVVGTHTSTEYQFINGKSSTLVSYTYTLAPRTTGVYEVGGATVTVDGSAFTAEPKKVEVTAGTAAQVRSSPDAGTATGESGDADIFIRTTVNNRQPYVGEQIILTFELYNRLTIWGDTEYEPPSTTGFWAVELPKIAPSTQKANNRMYKHNEVKTALFPTTSGTLTIGPAKLTYTTGGFFSAQQTRTLAAKPITVRVKPLPNTGKPPDFSGAVGSFKISAQPNKETARVGDVITVTVTVNGEGNLDMLTAVKTPDFSTFKTYDPKVATKILNSGFTVGGAKIWEYLLMPKFSGTTTLQPFSLSFFNPKTGKYNTVTTPPITFHITPGEVTAADAGSGSDTRNMVETIANDIRFIKPDRSVLASSSRKLYENSMFYLAYAVPLCAFAAAFALKRRRDAIERDSGLRRKLNSWKEAQRKLEQAVHALNSDETVEFCGHLSEAVVRFIGDRLNTDTGALTTGAIEEILIENGVLPELAEKVRKTLELSDFVRFSSTAAGNELPRTLLHDARDILQSLRETL